MNLSAIAIRRPVFTVMMTVALLVLGFMGMQRLGTDLFPDVTFPVVTVNAVYPGAGPREVETLVSKPVEDAVVSLNGVDRVRTYSREGLSTTMVIFKLGVDITEAATEVRERIAGIRYKFPDDVKEPIIQRFDVASVPVLIYTVRGAGSLSQTRKLAEDVIKPALEQVDGVASIEVKGGAAREIHVDLDRTRLDALGLDPQAIEARLRAANLTVPAGRYDEGQHEISVRTVGELQSVAEVRDIIVATNKDGSGVKLQDVASVEDGFEELRTRVRANGESAVSFSVLKQSGRNSVAVSDAVKAKLEVMKTAKILPEGVSASLILDQARFIKENAKEVEVAIVFGGAMAILIILIFMLDLRSTIISAVALPTSVIGTFFVMYVLGYTLNMMTLLGLSLAIGLLIDDAVVVRENIFKHMERGKSPAQAALDGTKEIALSVFATTMTIVAVFMPIAFVKGIAGQFFRQFGITVSAAVVISLLVAFTLDPMLSARFSRSLKHGEADRFAAIKRPFQTVFEGMDHTYRRILGWAVTHKILVGLFAIGSLVFMGWIGKLMGNEFVAAEDRGQFVVDLELPAGTALDETDKVSAAAEKKFKEYDEVKLVYSTVGPNGEANKATWRVVTSPKSERSGIPLAAIKDVARKAVAAIAPSAKVNVTDPAFVEGAQTEAPIMIDVRGGSGTGYETLSPVADNVAQILRTTPGVQDVQVKYTPGRPELRVEIDRPRATEQGISVAQVAMAVRTAMEGDEATRLRQGKDEIPIRVRLRKADRATPEQLRLLTLPTPRGPVKLGDVATFVRGEGPQVIEREDRSRQIQIWATPRGRALGDIITDMQPRMEAMKLPKDVTYTYDGQVRMMKENNEAVGMALMLAVLFIYIVLASQFESFIHPLTIMLTLPLALVGAIVALFLTNNTMAMGTMIGIILLMGLVTKNAILLIDRAIVRVRDHGETPLHAILEAGPERLRPILMTSAAMVLGMLPTALGNGEGSEFRGPMAVAVIGGVISSTLLSLVVVPVVYLAIENIKGFRRKKKAPPRLVDVDAAKHKAAS
ncbi:MAG: Cobalt-zinc-cadmium resistance protein CzcA [Myxococcales bacterium]|nr:Cobalt-zinc-cadmium resistance protein CzcA [Myxococcales bacterium]